MTDSQRAALIDVMVELSTRGYLHGIDFGIQGIPGAVADDVPRLSWDGSRYVISYVDYSGTTTSEMASSAALDSTVAHFTSEVAESWRRRSERGIEPVSESLSGDVRLLRLLRSKVELGTKLSPKATVALTGALRTAGSTAKNTVTQIRRIAAPISDAANRAVPMAADLVTAGQRAKMNMYDALITKHADKPWLQRMFDGSRFNIERSAHFEFNELSVTRPGTLPDGSTPRPFCVDSYTPGEVIVSRKATQFAEHSDAAGIAHIDEFIDKYNARTDGITIAPTDGNKAKLGDRADELIGEPLEGRMVLEVPIQDAPIPESILEHAEDLKIEIRQVPRIR